MAWRWLVHGKFSKWRSRSGQEACEGGGRVWTLPVAKEGPNTGLPPDGHWAEKGHRKLGWKGEMGFRRREVGLNRVGLGLALGLPLRNPLKKEEETRAGVWGVGLCIKSFPPPHSGRTCY